MYYYYSMICHLYLFSGF